MNVREKAVGILGAAKLRELKAAGLYVAEIAEKEDDEPFLCDGCGKEIVDFENDLFHFSGWVKGEGGLNGHIHLCEGCAHKQVRENANCLIFIEK